ARLLRADAARLPADAGADGDRGGGRPAAGSLPSQQPRAKSGVAGWVALALSFLLLRPEPATGSRWRDRRPRDGGAVRDHDRGRAGGRVGVLLSRPRVSPACAAAARARGGPRAVTCLAVANPRCARAVDRKSVV